MERGHRSGQMEPATMATLLTIIRKAMAGSSTAMAMSMKDTGSVTGPMDMESTRMWTGRTTMVTGSMTSMMGVGKKFGLMGPSLKANTRMVKNMEGENSCGPMAALLMATSLRTRCRDMVCTNGLMVDNIAACGKIINSMDRVTSPGKMAVSILVTMFRKREKVMEFSTGK